MDQKQTRIYDFYTKDNQLAIGCLITYWLFLSRDKGSTPAMGVKTWSYLQSSIVNAAIPSKSFNEYIKHLSDRLKVLSLSIDIWRDLISPKQVILRASLDEFGNMGEIEQRDRDQAMGWISHENLANEFEQVEIIKCLKNNANIATTLIRIRHEETKALQLEGDKTDE